MIIDQFNEFSDGQALTTGTNVASTNVIKQNVVDNTTVDMGNGHQSKIIPINVLAAFVGGTSVTVELVSSTSADLTGSPVVHASTGAILTAALTANTRVANIVMPSADYQEYIGLRYQISGTYSAGTIQAGIVAQVSDNKYYNGRYQVSL